MSEKHFKWRDIGKPPQRLNTFLTPGKELPSKFAPKRDQSQSSDKLFNNSRQRLHQSMEIHALNHTREESLKDKAEVREISPKREEVDEKRSSINRFPTISQIMHQSSFNADKKPSGFVVAELKKEFWAFKQNVLRQLERQKELVLKLVKQIVLTMDVELEKIGKRQGEEKGQIKTDQSTTENQQTKTLQEWKASLNNIKLTNTSPPIQYPQNPVKSVTSPPKFTANQPEQTETHVPPPSIPIDVSTFLSSISRLRTQFNEMDKLFEVTQLKKGVKS